MESTSGTRTSGGDRQAYGTDPGADALPLSELASLRVVAADTDSVSAFRRAALNTVDHLEEAVEHLVAERNALSAKLAYRLDVEAVTRGVLLAVGELRRAIGEDDVDARRWLASQLAALLAADAQTAAEIGSRLVGAVNQLADGRPRLRAASVGAGEWAAAMSATAGEGRAS